jgi:uncharacterized protein
MRILITGGTGFIGTRLTSRLVQEGHEVTILTRSERPPGEGVPRISCLRADPTEAGPWQEKVKGHDAVINLAGASIFSRWTEARKKAIRESRIRTTRNIVDGLPSRYEKRITLLSASAVGYYGFSGDRVLTETAPSGDDFLARVVMDWEKEALKAATKGARVVLPRLGIVLGEQGGALGRMIPLFKAYIGGPIGSGKQWFSWIHIADLAEAIAFLLKHPEISGPVNLCSPHPMRNRELATALGKALHRPSLIPAPGFVVKLVLGEFGSVVLKGQRVIPAKLLDNGFAFQYADIQKALQGLAAELPPLGHIFL